MSHSQKSEPRPSRLPFLRRRQSLRWRLLTLLGGMFLITLLVIGAGVYYFISANEQIVWQGRQTETAGYAADRIATFIHRVTDALSLAGSLERETIVANPQILPNVLRQNPALLEVVRLDAKGQVLTGAYQDEPLLANLFTIPQSVWFNTARAGQLYLGQVQISPTNEPYIITAVPAADGGVVAARLRMNLLWQVVAEIRFGETGHAYVINREGRIVVHTNPRITLSQTTLVGRPELTALLQAPQQQWNGVYTNFQGVEVIGVTARIPETEWIVITELPQAEAFATSRVALLLLSGGLAGFGLLVMLATGRFLRQLILKPMKRLQAGAERIGRGDLSHQINLRKYRDEISQVADAFNNMMSELHKTVARKGAILEAVFDGVISINTQGKIIELNRAAVNMFGYDRHQALDHKIADLIAATPSSDKQDRALGYYTQQTRTYLLDRRIEAIGKRANGAKFPIEITITRVVLESEFIFTLVVRDITKRKETETALIAARDQALEASRLKSELLAKVSHELRTPLNAILGFAELLQLGHYGSLADKQQPPTQQIITSTHYLTSMVNELLDQAQLDAGKLKLNRTTFAPANIVDPVQAQMQPLAQAKELTLTTDIAGDMPPMLTDDLTRLQQILTNLVSNAVKFTHQGNVKVNIYRPDAGYWAMQVSDTGPGIPPEAQAQIFEPFGQVDGSITRQHGGTGLGLSIVKQLTELMGGKIIVESEVGRGSTFTVWLPLGEQDIILGQQTQVEQPPPPNSTPIFERRDLNQPT